MATDYNKKTAGCLVIVDVSAVMRTFYRPLTSKFPLSIQYKGQQFNTSALFGLFKTFKKFGTECDYVFCYDTPRNFLKEKNPSHQYKKNRVKVGSDYYQQLNLSRTILSKIGLTVLQKDGYEADHLVYHTHQELSQFYPKTIVYTNDKDLAVLVNQTCEWHSTRAKQEPITLENYEEQLNCPYNALRLKKALVGDKSDNLKGVYRFGESKFREFVLFENIDQVNVYGREKELIESTSFLTDEEKLQALSDLSFILPLEVEDLIEVGKLDKLVLRDYLQAFQMKSLYGLADEGV